MKPSSLTVRFNCELKPFQHARVEFTVQFAKGDDKDEVRKEAAEYAASVMDEIEEVVFVARDRRKKGESPPLGVRKQVDEGEQIPGAEVAGGEDKPF